MCLCSRTRWLQQHATVPRRSRCWPDDTSHANSSRRCVSGGRPETLEDRVTLFRRSKLSMLNWAIVGVMFAGSAFAATTSKTRQIGEGEQAKVSGVILSRDGD